LAVADFSIVVCGLRLSILRVQLAIGDWRLATDDLIDDLTIWTTPIANPRKSPIRTPNRQIDNQPNPQSPVLNPQSI
jgi:hypothetical protein